MRVLMESNRGRTRAHRESVSGRCRAKIARTESRCAALRSSSRLKYSTIASGPRRGPPRPSRSAARSEEHTSELQSHSDLVCRLLLEKKKKTRQYTKHRATPHSR